MKTLLTALLCCLCWQWSGAQNALRFDGQDDWVQLPFAGTSTSMANSNPDFSHLPFHDAFWQTAVAPLPWASAFYNRYISLISISL